MNDETYTFIETQRERKTTGRSARHRKSGANSKRCSLPHERLTAKQLRERNGEMQTYNLNKPMNWKLYKEMPDDLKKEYLIGLKLKHGARAMDVAEMFGVGRSATSREITRLGIREYAEKPIKNMTPKWVAFINGTEKPQESVEPEAVSLPSEEINATQEPISAVKQAKELLSVNNGQICFTGEPTAVFEKMMQMLEPSNRYSICINFYNLGRE